MNIVVLGGSGFIGSRLVSELIAAGHSVRIFDKRPSAAHSGLVTLGDIRDAAAVTAALVGCDCAVNLAAEHADDVRPVSLYYEVNVGGAQNLLRAAEANGVMRLLFVSSVSVYGLDQPLADESSPLLPSNDYGRSKAAAEAEYLAWVHALATQRSLLMVRPCVVFGEGNRGNVHNLIDHIRRRRFVMIGSGENRKSIAYVGNLVGFLCACVEAPVGVQVYNYADKPDFSTRELVDTIRTLLPEAGTTRLRLPYAMALALGYVFDALAWLRGRPMAISSARVRKFCADTRIAADAVRATGFTPRVDLKQALALTIASLPREDG
jgi:nucleoside-diphosphate-sugar epimerase